MNKIILTSVAAIVALSSAPAFASDTASVAVNSVLPKACKVTASDNSLTLSSTEVKDGLFEYECNYTGSVNVNITSAHGGVQSGEGVDQRIVDYHIYLNDTPHGSDASSWVLASAAASYNPYAGITTSTTPNTTMKPSFAVALAAPLTVAGTYSDTLTVQVTP